MDQYDLMRQEIYAVERLFEDAAYDYRQEQQRLEDEYDLLYEKDRLLTELFESRCEVALYGMNQSQQDEIREKIYHQHQSWLDKVYEARRRTTMLLDEESEELEIQYRNRQNYLQEEIDLIYRKYQDGGDSHVD